MTAPGSQWRTTTPYPVPPPDHVGPRGPGPAAPEGLLAPVLLLAVALVVARNVPVPTAYLWPEVVVADTWSLGQVLTSALFPVDVAAWVVASAYLTRVRQRLRLRGHALALSDGWTWAAWVVPVANLFMPYRVVTELLRAQLGRLPGIVRWWWVAWLAPLPLHVAAALALPGDAPTATWIAVDAVSLVLDLFALTCWALVVVWLAGDPARAVPRPVRAGGPRWHPR